MNRDIILKGLADNEPLFNAVKEVILQQFELDLLSFPPDATDELIGQITRARVVGRRSVEAAFYEIARLRTLSQAREGVNPAR